MQSMFVLNSLGKHELSVKKRRQEWEEREEVGGGKRVAAEWKDQ